MEHHYFVLQRYSGLGSVLGSLRLVALLHASMQPTRNMSSPNTTFPCYARLRILSRLPLRSLYPFAIPSRECAVTQGRPLLINLNSFHYTISGYCAFTHKAGIHAKAILNNPSTYEILKPEDFGLTRYVSIGYALSHRSC